MLNYQRAHSDWNKFAAFFLNVIRGDTANRFNNTPFPLSNQGDETSLFALNLSIETIHSRLHRNNWYIENNNPIHSLYIHFTLKPHFYIENRYIHIWALPGTTVLLTHIPSSISHLSSLIPWYSHSHPIKSLFPMVEQIKPIQKIGWSSAHKQ